MNPDMEMDPDHIAQPEGTQLEGAQILDAAVREILHQVEVRPYATLAVAAGVGYVLGAGLPNWVSRLAFNVGSRMAMARVASMIGGGIDQP